MILSWAAVILIGIASLTVLTSRDWRWSIGGMAVLYVGVVILVSQHWPIGLALVKLVVGWMAGAALGLTRVGQQEGSENNAAWPSSRVFRLLAAGLVLLVIFSTASGLLEWFPGITIFQVWGGLILIGIGLLILGMTDSPFRVALALLMVLAGFEILYAAVEVSVLVAGLLAGVNLGLALAGAYLIFPRTAEEPQ